jgi:hypothetical protein
MMMKLMERAESLPSFPVFVRNFQYCQLRHIYVMQVETIWGKDSIVAQYERQVFNHGLRNMEVMFKLKFKTLMDSRVDYLRYIEGTNMLLEVFGLPKRTEEEIFWDIEQVRAFYLLAMNETRS